MSGTMPEILEGAVNRHTPGVTNLVQCNAQNIAILCSQIYLFLKRLEGIIVSKSEAITNETL